MCSSTIVDQKLLSDWEFKVAEFRLYLLEKLRGVDSLHFGSMNEVAVSFDLPSSRTVNLKGAKEVSVATKGQTVVWFSPITACGSKLPPMVIFKRETIERMQFQRRH